MGRRAHPDRTVTAGSPRLTFGGLTRAEGAYAAAQGWSAGHPGPRRRPVARTETMTLTAVGRPQRKEGTLVIMLILSGVLVLVLGGCVCVVWATRGGPPWVRAVAAATLAAGKLVRGVGPTSRSRNSDQLGDSDG